MKRTFDEAFASLTGNAPFPWQRALYERLLAGDIPASCDIPTGLGKTSVIAVWLLARAAGAPVPRRLVYVVNRRTVVDQTTEEVKRIRENRERAGIDELPAISTLRGQMADNRAWSADPSQPAVICGTVDMIGSRLLFSGYRIGFRTRPLHAGFLGQDALIVHDEAHLEPAFQHLLETIQAEQERAGDRWPLKIMALTATPRNGAAALRLGPEDLAHPVVARRYHATKKLTLHPHGDKDLVEKVVGQALKYAPSSRAVLVFLRSVEDVANAVSRLRKANAKVQQLTGTMRGFERDRLVAEDPVFRRFLPEESGATVEAGTVFLVCTSAGEVGVNLSADHLVCDLSTFDSMAQRFGRVNRFGLRTDSEIHVFHPDPTSLDTDKVRDARRRLETLMLLRQLQGDASPAAIAALDPEKRAAAFAPEPQLLTATDILFDAWAMTTIRGALPGRPPVAPYLHGVAEWEPPTTHVAWRDEVDLVMGKELLERYPAQDLIDDYPLKPHEILTDRTLRILDTLAELAGAKPEARKMPVWVVDENGRVDAELTLDSLISGDRKANEARFARCTLLLSPSHLRPVEGMLTVEGWEPASRDGIDVADAWLGEDEKPMRKRLLGDTTPPDGMRLIRTLVLERNGQDAAREEQKGEGDDASDEGQRWSWYERSRGADDEGSRSAEKPVLLEVHCADVESKARTFVERLPLEPGVKRAVVLAAKLHDIGKARRVWQRSLGNTDPTRPLAKSGGAMYPMDITPYRHELGSILDAERNGLLAGLDPEERELTLHLVAAHHGRARPHFPPEEQFDPEAKGVDVREVAARVVTRFAALQRRFGRWGLAYLESLVRAADYAASAQPSQVVEVER